MDLESHRVNVSKREMVWERDSADLVDKYAGILSINLGLLEPLDYLRILLT